MGNVVYDNLPKTMLMMVVDDEMLEKLQSRSSRTAPGPETSATARSSSSPVEEAYTIRTGQRGL